MKFLYIANQRMPSEKAYGQQIAKMCESFADLGAEVELVVPKRGHLAEEDLFSFYEVKRNFKFTQIASPDWYWPGQLDRLAFWMKNLISAGRLARYALVGNYDVIYSRDEFPIYFLLGKKKSVIFEAHKYTRSYGFFYNYFKKRDFKMITITQGLKNEFIKRGFRAENILVAPDGVDEEKIKEQLANPLSASEARQKLNLPLDKKIVVYTGSFFNWKGVGILAEAAKLLEKEAIIVAVGGDGGLDHQKLENFIKKNRINNFYITGYVHDSKRRSLYRAAADVFVLPNVAGDKISELYTSPLKLFAYMTARRPIVASDLPSLREILNEQNAILVKPDSPCDLADGLKVVLSNPANGYLLSEQSFRDVKKYTWQNRARTILGLME